jgi:hypothetical protein
MTKERGLTGRLPSLSPSDDARSEEEYPYRPGLKERAVNQVSTIGIRYLLRWRAALLIWAPVLDGVSARSGRGTL